MPESSYFGGSRMAPKEEPKKDDGLEKAVDRLTAAADALEKREPSPFGVDEKFQEQMFDSPLLPKKRP